MKVTQIDSEQKMNAMRSVRQARLKSRNGFMVGGCQMTTIFLKFLTYSVADKCNATYLIPDGRYTVCDSKNDSECPPGHVCMAGHGVCCPTKGRTAYLSAEY